MHTRIALSLMAIAAATSAAHAQTAPAGQKSLASTLNVYVFPNAGQAPAQQSKDEGECYNWAVQNTGSDPFAGREAGRNSRSSRRPSRRSRPRRPARAPAPRARWAARPPAR